MLFSISAISLNGCSHVRVPASRYLVWQDRYVRAQAVTYWQLSGVLSVSGQHHRSIVRFTWEQEPNKYKISISGPFNFGSIYIEGNEREVRLWRTKQRCEKAKSPELLFAKYLGWQLPLYNLRYWILGIPAPTSAVTERNFDRHGHLVTFMQDGWRIKCIGFRCSSYNIDLPSLIELSGYNTVIKIRTTACSA